MPLREAYLHALLARYEVVPFPFDAGRREPHGVAAPFPMIVHRLAPRPARAAPLSQAGDSGWNVNDADPHSDLCDLNIDGCFRPDPDWRAQFAAAGWAVGVDGPEDALSCSPGQRMVVLGGPGTGKTTLLRALVSRAGLRALHDAAAPLPILVDLPDMAEHGGQLQRYLPRLTASLGLPAETAAELAAALEEGAMLACLDGLDEVAPAKREVRRGGHSVADVAR